MDSRQPESAVGNSRYVTLAAAAVLTVIMAITYWSAVAALVRRWYGDPDYTYGFLVPIFAAVLLWYRRDARERGFQGKSLGPFADGSRRGDADRFVVLLL